MSNITTTFQIAGMTCEACQKVVQKKLSKITDVAEVLVDKNSGIVVVSAKRDITLEETKIALEGTDYSLVE